MKKIWGNILNLWANQILPATESLGERACDATYGEIKTAITIVDTRVLVVLALTIFNLQNQEPRNVHIFCLNPTLSIVFCNWTRSKTYAINQGRGKKFLINVHDIIWTCMLDTKKKQSSSVFCGAIAQNFLKFSFHIEWVGYKERTFFDCGSACGHFQTTYSIIWDTKGAENSLQNPARSFTGSWAYPKSFYWQIIFLFKSSLTKTDSAWIATFGCTKVWIFICRITTIQTSQMAFLRRKKPNPTSTETLWDLCYLSLTNSQDRKKQNKSVDGLVSLAKCLCINWIILFTHLKFAVHTLTFSGANTRSWTIVCKSNYLISKLLNKKISKNEW